MADLTRDTLVTVNKHGTFINRDLRIICPECHQRNYVCGIQDVPPAKGLKMCTGCGAELSYTELYNPEAQNA
jgi:hypothetical protein